MTSPHPESPSAQPAGPSVARLHDVLRDLGPTQAVNALVGFLFAATGPVAIILSAGAQGNLSQAELASWIFGSFFVNGLLTIVLSAWYRTPLIHFFTIPGTVLVGQTLGHASFAQVIGAFVVTGVLITALGLTGWMKRAQSAVPMPIVMGMVAGVFLRFGTDVVRALHDDVWIATPMVLAFLLLSALPRLARSLGPPDCAGGVRLRVTQAELADAKEQLRLMRASRVWRVTEPLRKGLDRFRTLGSR
jgi:benzoate membrane transport protein